MMKAAVVIGLVCIAACSADRREPAPPSPLDPTEPFPDPVTSSDGIGSGGFATTGPVMQRAPLRVAKHNEGMTGSGGITGTETVTTSATTAIVAATRGTATNDATTTTGTGGATTSRASISTSTSTGAR